MLLCVAKQDNDPYNNNRGKYATGSLLSRARICQRSESKIPTLKNNSRKQKLNKKQEKVGYDTARLYDLISRTRRFDFGKK